MLRIAQTTDFNALSDNTRKLPAYFGEVKT